MIRTFDEAVPPQRPADFVEGSLPYQPTPAGQTRWASRATVLPATLTGLVACAFFLIGLGTMPLLDPDEGRHAGIAREMLESSNWLSPTFNGEPYRDKPAGFYWLLASSLAAFGETPWAARLPSAVAAITTVVWTARAATVAYGGFTGTAAGVVLATSILFLALGRLTLMDMTFTALLAGSALHLHTWAAGRRRPFPWPAWILVGTATLVKGPVAVVLPVAAAVVHRLLSGRSAFLRDLRIPAGVGVAVLVAGPWYGVIAVTDFDYFREFLVGSNVYRFLHVNDVGDRESIFYYLYMLPAAFLPWSLVWPGILWSRLPRRALGGDGSVWLVAWAVAVTGFFTFSRSKLPTYVLPAFPVLAILTARAFAEARLAGGWPEASRRWISALSWLWTTSLVIAPVAIALLLHRIYADARPAILAATIAAVPAGFAARQTARPERWLAWTTVTMAVLGVIFVANGVEHLGRWRSLDVPGKLIAEHVPEDVPVYSFRFKSNTIRFYGKRPVGRLDSLEHAADVLSGEEPVIVGLRTWHRHDLPKLITRPVWVLWGSWGSHRFLAANFLPDGVQPVSRFEPAGEDR